MGYLCCAESFFERSIENIGNEEFRTGWRSASKRGRVAALSRLVVVGDFIAEPGKNVFELFHHTTTPARTV